MIKCERALMCAWVIAFALSVFLILTIPDRYTNVIITGIIFDCVAFISQFIFWLKSLKKDQSAEGIFQNASGFVVSCAYLTVEFVFNVIYAEFPNVMPFKTALIVHVCILATVWITLAALLGTRNHIRRVESRQRDHHIEL